ASQTRSASPPSQRPPGSAGAVGAVAAPDAGAAERPEECGPAQDVRSTVAARRARAALFVMPDGTAAAPARFPEISGLPGCHPARPPKSRLRRRNSLAPGPGSAARMARMRRLLIL